MIGTRFATSPSIAAHGFADRRGRPDCEFGEYGMGTFGALTTVSAALRAGCNAWKTFPETSPTRDHGVQAHRHQFSRSHSQTGLTNKLDGTVNPRTPEAPHRCRAMFSRVRRTTWTSTARILLGAEAGTFTTVPVFDGVDRYTRRGDFSIDTSGLRSTARLLLEAFSD